MTTDRIQMAIDNFSDGVRVQMLIDRGVGNTNKGSKRWVNKLISHDSKSYADNVEKLLNQQKYLNNPDIRLYACVNNRKIKNAITHLRHVMIDLPESDCEGFFCHIHDRFVSSLMQPSCKLSKNFLLDVDNPDFFPELFISSIALAHKIETIQYYKTPNGYHIITKPFDVRLIEDTPFVDIKRDGLMLLNTLPA